jgi:long-chain fatty acid transport protein
VLTALAFTSTASATTGYFGLGFGAKSMGLAGATVSNPQDAIAAASNPAGMALVGERVDINLRFFSPNERNAKLYTTSAGGTFDVEDKSRRNLFIIPNLGYTSQINEKMWWGLSIYGNGGMNTAYDRNIYDEAFAVLGAAQQGIPNPGTPPPILICDPTGVNGPLPPTPAGCGALVPEGATTGFPNTGTLGVDLAQAIFAPTLSMKINQEHTVGASLLIGVQRFSARGLGDFQNPAFVTSPPASGLTNNDSDWSYGAGVRLGWIGDVHPRVTLGAAASSKIYMTEFDDYDDLFAENGDFDIPAMASASVTFKATPKVNLSFDFERIFYEGVDSISNPGPILTAMGPMPPPGTGKLGTSNGLGFGWEDINIYRLALDYRHNDQWTFRGGVAMNDQPIPDDQLLFNIIAPAVIEKHVTMGFTYRPNKSSEWSFAYMHAFKEEVKSDMTAFGIPGKIDMYQNSVDVGYALKF